jgi:outer membrane protein assembly factor BamD
MRSDRFFVAAAGMCLAVLSCASAYGQGKVKVIKPKQAAPAAQPSSEPDKVLYDRAMTDFKHKRYEEERLSLDVLINTYPDSEYLAKAKLAKADAYYAEGGVSNLTQAIGEYKSFVVFFPFMTDEDSYSQMQIGMAHYKMMGKSDRDDSEALSAEAEFQTFMVKYPDSKYAPSAEQKLRDVQEVIADGDYKVARFYYLRPDYRASAARLIDLTQRYPLYSESDEALWMLSSIYATAKKVSKNEDDKNHWSDLQGRVLAQIVTNYPLSPRAAQAKEQLKAMGMAVPAADPVAMKREQKQAEYVKAHHQNGLMKSSMSMLHGAPDISMAAQVGAPNLTPPDNSISAADVLKTSTTGPQFNLATSSATPGGSSADSTVVPGTPVDTGGGPITENGTVNAPTTSSTAAADPANAATTAPAADSNAGSNEGSSGVTGAADQITTAATPAAGDPPSQSGAAADSSSTAPQTGSNSPAPAPATQQAAPAGKDDSSSKKKKGIGKLNPF